jgi:putative copper export protein
VPRRRAPVGRPGDDRDIIGPVLPVTVDTVRVTLHVLAATVWVGGQITLAGLLPTVRGLGEDAPRQVARAFNRVAWPAYGILLVTGVWNLLEVQVGDRDTEYHVTLGVKLLVVAASGIAAGVHASTRSKALLAATGAVGALAALTAVLLGVQLGA